MSDNNFLMMGATAYEVDNKRSLEKAAALSIIEAFIRGAKTDDAWREYILIPLEWVWLAGDIKSDCNLKGVYLLKEGNSDDAYMLTKKTIKRLKKKRLIREICI